MQDIDRIRVEQRDSCRVPQSSFARKTAQQRVVDETEKDTGPATAAIPRAMRIGSGDVPGCRCHQVAAATSTTTLKSDEMIVKRLK